MENDMNKKFRLLSTGYLIGELSDLVTDDIEFEKHVANIRHTFHTSRELFQYRNVVKMHPEYNMHVKIEDIAERRRVIEENNYEIGQQWYETNGGSDLIQSAFVYFQGLVKKIMVELYPELSLERNNFRFNDAFTVFTKGDFIEPHTDGMNLGRLCVVLIYLSNENEYDQSGGVFRIPDEDVDLLPVKGKFAILDFTRNNLKHEVTLVHDNFERFTYNSFVYNTDKERA
jgi:Rps23 Pro-64 3,4-dihydroxylase Tpa1-like proline 4-hydroxylase